MGPDGIVRKMGQGWERLEKRLMGVIVACVGGDKRKRPAAWEKKAGKF